MDRKLKSDCVALQLGKLSIAFEMTFIQNNENFLVAVLLFQTIIPCTIKIQDCWRLVEQSP